MKIPKAPIQRVFGSIEITNITPKSEKFRQLKDFAQNTGAKIQDGLNPHHQPSFYLHTQEKTQETNFLDHLTRIFQNSDARIKICSPKETEQAFQRLLNELA